MKSFRPDNLDMCMGTRVYITHVHVRKQCTCENTQVHIT